MNFSKMQASGNDFVMVNARKMRRDWSVLARKMCHRHFGVGADGLITVDKKDSNIIMRIFNADGSEAEVCGNGLRCFAKYIVDYGIVDKSELEIKTNSGIKHVRVYKSQKKVNRVKVNMGKPKFSDEEIPVRLESNTSKVNQLDIISIIKRKIKVDDAELNLHLVSMGNPHAVAYTSIPVQKYSLTTIGPLVEKYEIFPRRINFEIARIVDRESIDSRVWERGVGETMACGSGACAIAVVSIMQGLTNDKVKINMPGGTLQIFWDGKGDVFLSGPVEEVFRGIWPDHQ